MACGQWLVTSNGKKMFGFYWTLATGHSSLFLMTPLAGFFVCVGLVEQMAGRMGNEKTGGNSDQRKDSASGLWISTDQWSGQRL